MQEQPKAADADFFARHGGLILIVWGIVLVTLACLFADHATIAPIFAFTGVASTIVGVLAARIEGDFELTATGLKAKLQAVARREDLTLEDKGDELVRLVDGKGGRRPTEAANEDVEDGPSLASRRGEAFEKKAEEYFRTQGWTVQRPDPFFLPVSEVMGTKDGKMLAIEARARTKLSAADVEQLLKQLERAKNLADNPDFEFALVVPPGSLSPRARDRLTENTPVPVQIVELPE